MTFVYQRIKHPPLISDSQNRQGGVFGTKGTVYLFLVKCINRFSIIEVSNFY